MSFNIRFIGVFIGLLVTIIPASADMRTELLRKRALENGLIPPNQMVGTINSKKSKLGEKLFKDERLSFNGDTSCQTCHRDEFSSADGLPNAIGVGGKGFGLKRMDSGGVIVPRNTLPLWGRGSIGFDTFFWDGKVVRTDQGIVSQFGTNPPSDDPLKVAAHLPFVELREMVREDGDINDLKTETAASANKVFDDLLVRLLKDDTLSNEISRAFDVERIDIKFSMFPAAIAEHIRDKFRIKETRFHKFVFGGGMLSQSEISGGLIFFGKGRCFACHSGAMFTDQKFYTVPFAIAGFGKNGFGQDFGRYNTTFDPEDLFKVRTPPLYNVSETGPYFHSGSAQSLAQAIVAHFDPLRASGYPEQQNRRIEFYKALKAWSRNSFEVPSLTKEEVQNLVSFLKTLNFN